MNELKSLNTKSRFKNLNDQALLNLTHKKAQEERSLTLQVIELLQEIRNRHLHLKRGYASLHEFCVKELKYSDGAAFRRIKALKLVEDLPEVVSSIESGELSLTTASKLQTVFEAKSKTNAPLIKEEKIKLLTQVKNQSSRTVERIVADQLPEVILTQEKIKPMGLSLTKLEIYVDNELLQKIERLKNLSSHKNNSLKDLLKNLVESELKRKDPELKVDKLNKPEKSNNSPTINKTLINNKINKKILKKTPTASAAKSNIIGSRYISSSLKYHIWMRDKGRCTYLDPLTRRACESKHYLQYDHIRPLALGGKNIASNLRLLCFQHNKLMAIQCFGANKVVPNKRI